MMRWKAKAAIVTVSTITVVATAWSVYSAGLRAGEARTRALWDAEVAQMAIAQARELERAMAKTAELQAQINQQQRTHRNEVARINARHASILDGLRDRPERPDSGGVPEGAGVGIGAGAGCTGAGLAGPDARFLAGFAADAARLQSALSACIAHSREIERAVNSRN